MLFAMTNLLVARRFVGPTRDFSGSQNHIADVKITPAT